MTTKYSAGREQDKDVSAETFSDAVAREEPADFQAILAHTRAEALATVAEHFLATTGEDPRFESLKGSERCQIMLHVDINTLREQSHAGDAALAYCHLDDKHWISPRTAKRLSCDASLDNLVTLCRYHHRQLHRGSFTIAVEKNAASQALVFSTPSGRAIETSYFPQLPDVSAETSGGGLAPITPAVGAGTCVTQWQGEDCDYGMAIDALLKRDGGGRCCL